jgi:hypothetical protein
MITIQKHRMQGFFGHIFQQFKCFVHDQQMKTPKRRFLNCESNINKNIS